MCKLLSMHAWYCREIQNSLPESSQEDVRIARQQTEDSCTSSALVCTSDYSADNGNITGKLSFRGTFSEEQSLRMCMGLECMGNWI